MPVLNKNVIQISPWAGHIPYPKHLTPLPFQINQAAPWALSRNYSYLALDPGLGKTIIAALIINALKKPVTYICPPFLVTGVKEELEKWGVTVPVTIIPDSMLHKYPALPGHILIVDEAHRFKNGKSRRTKALLSASRTFQRVVFLSGTPMPNRPLELFSILSRFAPETIGFKNKFEYGMRYCAGFKGGWGWDFTGASNVPELAKAVKARFMLRLKKGDVLKDLPPKTEEMIVIGKDLPPQSARLDREILKQCGADLMKIEIAENAHTATYRKELGIAKAPYAVDFIKSLLDETEESVLVFAIHKKAMEALREGLAAFDLVIITGDTGTKFRHGLAKEFQENPKRRLLIGNIDACGVGFTLTKATRVIFAEFSWVPAVNEQASDRAHRIGQKDNVLVQYLVFKNSIDRAVLESNLRKKEIIKHV